MSWMVWTTPTAIFFVCIAGAIVGVSVWQKLRPESGPRGFLPFLTSRGDRLFLGLLTSALLHLVWLGLSDIDPGGLTVVCAIGTGLLVKYG